MSNDYWKILLPSFSEIYKMCMFYGLLVLIKFIKSIKPLDSTQILYFLNRYLHQSKHAAIRNFKVGKTQASFSGDSKILHNDRLLENMKIC
jgi:hypothetical protein